MRLLRTLLIVVVIGLPIAVLVAIWACFQPEPLIVRDVKISPETIERAKRILDAHDPRKARQGEVRTLRISQDDLNIAANYALSRVWNGATDIALQAGNARIRLTLAVPGNPFGRWLNLDGTLRETAGLPTFDQLKVGALHVPGFLADFALARLISRLTSTTEGELVNDVVRSVNLAANQLRVVYKWREDIIDRTRAILIGPEDLERFKAYSERLADAVVEAKGARSVSLARIFPPIFELARKRSAAGDAAKENRAAIMTLALYSDGRSLAAIVPAANAWRKPAPITFTLNGRDDFPKHFLISAALAAEAGTPLANAIGLQKEVEDSRGGSGFSFNDIAADLAGTRFGKLAASNPRKLQESLAAGVTERVFMPDVSDLPEFMPEAEFKRRYGGIGAPGYNKMMADIEQRVGSVALFR